MGPLAVAGIGAGIKALGGLFGGSKSNEVQIPQWLIDAVMKMANQDQSGFLVDKGAYDASYNAKVKNVLAQMPVGVEAFNTDLASRGIYRTGEAPKNLYSNVYAPIAGQLGSAAAESNLGYTEAMQRGQLAGASLRAQLLQSLLGAFSGNTKVTGGGGIGGLLTGLGEGWGDVKDAMDENRKKKWLEDLLA